MVQFQLKIQMVQIEISFLTIIILKCKHVDILLRYNQGQIKDPYPSSLILP